MHAALVYYFFIFIFLVSPTSIVSTALSYDQSESVKTAFLISHEQTSKDNQTIVQELISLMPSESQASLPLCTLVSSYLSELFAPLTKEQAIEHCTALSQYLLSKMYFNPEQNLKRIIQDEQTPHTSTTTNQIPEDFLLKLYRSIAHYEFENLRNPESYTPKIEMSFVEKQDERNMRYIKYIFAGLLIYQIFDTMKKSEQLSTAERIAAEERKENRKIGEAAEKAREAAERRDAIAAEKRDAAMAAERQTDRLILQARDRSAAVQVNTGGKETNGDVTGTVRHEFAEERRRQEEERKRVELTQKTMEMATRLKTLQSQIDQVKADSDQKDRVLQVVIDERNTAVVNLGKALNKETGEAFRKTIRGKTADPGLNPQKRTIANFLTIQRPASTTTAASNTTPAANTPITLEGIGTTVTAVKGLLDAIKNLINS